MDKAFSRWLQTEPLGQYILAKEQAFYRKACQDIFGRYSLQMGLNEIPLLGESRISSAIMLGQDKPANLIAKTEAIPCDWRSIDLVVLPHTLELTENPHQVLSEVQRVLVPEGRVIITGFNPVSLFGLRKQCPCDIAPRAQMVGLWRLKDWLKLLGFEISSGQFMVYVPAVRQVKSLNSFQFMEKAGNRWWPQLAAVYALVATKQVYNVTPITPAWKQRSLRPSLTEIKTSRKDMLKKKQTDQYE